MANVYKRDRSKCYYYRFTYAGSEYRGSTGSDSYQTAKKYLAEKMTEVKAAIGKSHTLALDSLLIALKRLPERERKRFAEEAVSQIRAIAAPLMSLDAVWELYDAAPKRQTQTESYKKALKGMWTRFKEYAVSEGVSTVQDVDDHFVAIYAKQIFKDQSPRTFNKYITFYRQVWDIIAIYVGSSDNPWKSIKTLELDTIHKKPLETETLAKVFKAATPEYKTLLAIGGYTGLRLGDCCQLRWANVVDGQIRIIAGKTKKRQREVIIPIHNNLMTMLNTLDKSGEFVLPALARQYQAAPYEVTDIIQALLDKAGLKTTVQRAGNSRRQAVYGFHSLRHSFITMLANANIPRHVVMDMVGHSTTAVHQIYQHVDSKQKADAVAKLPEIK